MTNTTNPHPSGTTTRSIRLDCDVLEALEEEADRQDRSVNRLINQAIKELLGRVRTKVTIHGVHVNSGGVIQVSSTGTGSESP